MPIDHEQPAVGAIADARCETVAEEVKQGKDALDGTRRVGRLLLNLEGTLVVQQAVEDMVVEAMLRPRAVAGMTFE